MCQFGGSLCLQLVGCGDVDGIQIAYHSKFLIIVEFLGLAYQAVDIRLDAFDERSGICRDVCGNPVPTLGHFLAVVDYLMHRDVEADGIRSVCRSVGLHELSGRDGSLIYTVCH